MYIWPDWRLGPRSGIHVRSRRRCECVEPSVRLLWGLVLVGPPGFEPGTSCTPSKRASQAAPRPELSYFTRFLVRNLPMFGSIEFPGQRAYSEDGLTRRVLEWK